MYEPQRLTTFRDAAITSLNVVSRCIDITDIFQQRIYIINITNLAM